MNKWNSWQVFFISIGLLFIMFSPQSTQPMVMLIGGLSICLIRCHYIKEIDS